MFCTREERGSYNRTSDNFSTLMQPSKFIATFTKACHFRNWIKSTSISRLMYLCVLWMKNVIWCHIINISANHIQSIVKLKIWKCVYVRILIFITSDWEFVLVQIMHRDLVQISINLQFLIISVFRSKVLKVVKMLMLVWTCRYSDVLSRNFRCGGEP